MSVLYDLAIELKPSGDYRKLCCLTASFALLCTIYSPLAGVFKIIAAILIMFTAAYAVRHGLPAKKYRMLSGQPGNWLLCDQHGEIHCYHNMIIRFDAALFMLLQWQAESTTQHMVLFTDQITIAQRRALYFAQDKGRTYEKPRGPGRL